MALAVQQDFVVKNGVVIKGAAIVTSSTNQKGSLQSAGGAAIAKNLIVGSSATIYGPTTIANYLAITNTTGTIDGTTGALQVAGGVGIAGNLYVGGTITATTLVVETLYVDYTTITQTLVTSPDIFTITNTTGVASATGGALNVYGGVGIQGGLYVNNSVTATNFYGNVYSNNTSTTMVGWATTATNLYNTSTTMVGWATTATNLYNTSTTNVGYATTSGYAVTFNTNTLVTTSVNLVGGAPGSLPYQTSADTTAMLPIGSNGYILYVNSGLPAWTPVTGLSAGSSNTATNIAGGLANQIPYQSAPGITTFSSNLVFNGTTFTTTNIVITGTTNATSTITGALQIAGGVGIGKDIWMAGGITFNGTLTALPSYFTGSISGTTLTVTSAPAGTIAWGQTVLGNTVPAETYIIDQLTGTSGGVGTYLLSTSTSVGSSQLWVQNIFADGDIKIKDGHGIFVQDRHDAGLYDRLIGIYEADATIKVGSINTNGLSLDNNKEYKVESNLNTGTYMAVAKVDASDNVILASGNANTTQIRVGGDSTNGFNYAQKFFNGGEAHIPVGLRIGNNINSTAYGANLEITTYDHSGAAFVTYRDSSSDPYGSFLYGLRYRGTLNSPLPVAEEDVIMEFGAGSWDGASVNGGGELMWVTDGAVVQGVSNPSRAELYVTTVGNTNQSLALKIDSSLNAHLYKDLTVTGTIYASTLTLTSVLETINTTTGALTVAGGVGIGKSLYVGNTATIGGDLNVYGNIYMKGVGLDTISGTTGTFVNLIITGTNATLGGINSGTIFVAGGVNLAKDLFVATTATINHLDITSTLDTGYSPGSTATSRYYSLATKGGFKAAGSIVAGGVISAGDYNSTGTNAPLGNDSGSRDGFYLLNNMQSARTISAVSGTSPVTIDAWDKTKYSTAKYIVQVKDSTSIFVSELMFIQDLSDVYMSQYGLVYNDSILGTFDGSIVGGDVVITFTPTGATSMTIQVIRQSVLTSSENYIIV